MAPVASPSNPYKRHIDAVQRVYDCAKRLKTSHESNDSAPSTVSDESALVPTSVPEDTIEASGVESDDESWVSESSEEPSDESDFEEDEDGSGAEEEDDEADDNEKDAEQDEETAVNLRANRGERPSYKLPDDEEIEDIRPFLKDFLPKLKAANEELEAQKEAGTLQTSEIVGEDEGNDGEQYIEMNLGLGVLEEKNDDGDTHAQEPLESENEADETKQQGQEKDILGKLMGRDKVEHPVGIQEVT